MKTAIIAGRILLYHFNDGDALQSVSTWAVLPDAAARDWEGLTLSILDWKINDGKVAMSYMTSSDPWAPIYDITLEVVQERVPLRPPNKSKNWEFLKYSGYWLNKKTGAKSYV